MKFLRLICAALLFGLAFSSSPALAQTAQQGLTIDLTGGGQMTERLMQIIGLITILSLAPSILIMMTSFTFILGVMPLVLASGAGASARRSLGIAVASGMLASTCLAVLFVPAFFVVLQTWAERKTGGKNEFGHA